MLAVGVLAVVAAASYVTFSVLVKAWQRGTRLVDSIHHGDFAIEQIVTALRSAYYPAGGVHPDYGFRLDNGGDGPRSSDTLSWVKLGGALIGQNNPIEGSPHRVSISIEKDDKGREILGVRAWSLLSEIEEFDPEEDTTLEPVANGIIGMNCRCKDPESTEKDEIEWIDDWDHELTNRLPTVVELTLYLEPPEKGAEPVEIKRIVEIPLGTLSWQSVTNS